MRYSSINTCECTNGLGWGVSLFTQGCPIHCKGCFNPETWDFDGGKKLTDLQKLEIYKALKPNYITRFSILGGEPLIIENLYELNNIIHNIKKIKSNIKIWLWTGYSWDELKQLKSNLLLEIFESIDYLVCGPFIEKEKNLTLPWRGSSNQQIIDMQATNDEKIVYFLK